MQETNYGRIVQEHINTNIAESIEDIQEFEQSFENPSIEPSLHQNTFSYDEVVPIIWSHHGKQSWYPNNSVMQISKLVYTNIYCKLVDKQMSITSS